MRKGDEEGVGTPLGRYFSGQKSFRNLQTSGGTFLMKMKDEINKVDLRIARLKGLLR